MTSTCPRCRASWTGLSTAHCGGNGCHQTFAAPSLFDAHRDGRTHTCRDPATVTDSQGARRLYLRDGLWRGPEPTPEELRRMKTRRPRRSHT